MMYSILLTSEVKMIVSPLVRVIFLPSAKNPERISGPLVSSKTAVGGQEEAKASTLEEDLVHIEV